MSSRSRTQTAPSTNGRLWAMGSVLLIGAAAAAFSVSALAGGHRGSHGDHGHKGGHHGEVCMHEGQAGRHAGGFMMGESRHLDRLLGDAKLTDAQRTQIRDIQTQARADLKALHGADAMPMLHGMSLLSEAKPDAAAAEKARQQMLARHDKVSQRMQQRILTNSRCPNLQCACQVDLARFHVLQFIATRLRKARKDGQHGGSGFVFGLRV